MSGDDASGPEHDRPVPSLAAVQAMFTRFAETYPDLRLYRAICEGAAADDEVAAIVLAARPGQVRPVLLLAALHDLVLRRPDLPAARWYPSVTGGPVPDGDPWPDVRRTALDHAAELHTVVATRATQTNEVNRAVHLAPLVARAAADVPASPVALVEVGCSAGLLLGLDRYRIEVATPGGGTAVLGDPSSTVRCAGEQRSGPPVGDLRLPRVVERVGLDLDPVALDDADAVRWLEACLWPDVPGRLERFRAAVRLLRDDPPVVVAGDMVGDLAATCRSARAVAAAGGAEEAVHLVVFSSWALTYVPREERSMVADALAALAADGRPVSWLTAEPPACVPEVPVPEGTDVAPAESGAETVLGARRWRDGAELPPAAWGDSHPHGEWFHWHP